MAIWNHRLKLKDVFHDDTIPFARKRDIIVGRIQSAPWYPDDEDDEFCYTVEELAETEDTEQFDFVWDAVYDYADEHRIWIETV